MTAAGGLHGYDALRLAGSRQLDPIAFSPRKCQGGHRHLPVVDERLDRAGIEELVHPEASL